MTLLNLDLRFLGVMVKAPYQTLCCVCGNAIAKGAPAYEKPGSELYTHLACGEPIKSPGAA